MGPAGELGGSAKRRAAKALGWFGVVIGVAGLASVVPPLHDAAIAFGLLQIVWFVWVGIVLLRTAQPAGQVLALEVEPA